MNVAERIPYTVRSKYAGCCQRCSDPVLPGQQITKDNGGWSHRRCKKRGRAADRAARALTKNAALIEAQWS